LVTAKVRIVTTAKSQVVDGAGAGGWRRTRGNVNTGNNVTNGHISYESLDLDKLSVCVTSGPEF
jgi:hypothetical protein